MPSYLITGVSRGIGFEFLEKISSDPANTVVGLVRNVAETKVNIASWNRSNVYIFEGHLTDYESLKKAVELTSNITGGKLDVVIANAGLIPSWAQFEPMSSLGKDVAQLNASLLETFQTNCVGNIHLFNLVMPLVLKGTIKKVITISTGMADTDLTTKFNLHEGITYSISKAAMNMAVAKFSAEYSEQGVLFLAICPGSVNTGQYDNLSEEDGAKLAKQGAKFVAYAPHFTGPLTPEESVKAVLDVVEKASLANGDGGAYLSHFGNKQWL